MTTNSDVGVLFDLDETLLDRSASIRSYANDFFIEFSDRIRHSDEAFVRTFIELDGNGYVPREVFFSELADELAAPGLDADSLQGHYFSTIWEAPSLIEGALNGLSQLRTMGVPVGIVTNGGSVNQRKKIDNTGLSELVDVVIVSGELGVKKPDPHIFSSACGALGVEAGASWFVGDNPLLDICGGDAFGLQTIWVRRSTAWPDDRDCCYTHAVDRLSEAMDLLIEHTGVIPGGG